MKNIRLKLMAIGLLTIFFFGSISVVEAQLNKKEINIIKIAFMNGYLEALQRSSKERREMSRNQDYLKETVQQAADRYLKRVQALND